MSPEEIKFFAEVELLLKPIISPTIEYRLHYNELGEITSCSMIDHPETSNYLVVSKEEYNQYYDYIIVNKKLKKIDRDAGYRVKLAKADAGYKVVKNHAALILEPNEEYSETEYYAYRNS